MDDLEGIVGYSKLKKGYMQTKKGYYTSAFTTTIQRATNKDIELANKYGLELVSQYESIDIRLLHLSKKDTYSDLVSNSVSYEVNVGVLVHGILIIKISRYLTQNTVSFYYMQRISGSAYKFKNSLVQHYTKEERAKKKRYGRRKQRLAEKNKKNRK